MKSTYEQRARIIHSKPEQKPISPHDKDAAWKQVKSSQDAAQWYKQYYPEIGEELASALGHYFDRAVKGEIPIASQFNKKTEEQEESGRWNWYEELEQEKLKGKIEQTKKRLEELLND